MPRERKPAKTLEPSRFNDPSIAEIGIDEAGRGPLFGRVYAAAVVLPQDDTFPHHLMKDSKKFTSRKKLAEVADKIKESCIAYSVEYAESEVIDSHNPLAATMLTMNKAISNVARQLEEQQSLKERQPHLLVDGSYFRPAPYVDKDVQVWHFPYTCVTSGDDTYSSIAAASILAKNARDSYIDELCDQNEALDALYGLRKNKGYGTKAHLDGIKQYGITKWHRKTFGICKNAPLIELSVEAEAEAEEPA